MPCHECSSCRAFLHSLDEHSECAALMLGQAHAKTVLTEMSCSHCESMSLTSLHSWMDFFNVSNPIRCAPPFLPLRNLRVKNSRDMVQSRWALMKSCPGMVSQGCPAFLALQSHFSPRGLASSTAGQAGSAPFWWSGIFFSENSGLMG